MQPAKSLPWQRHNGSLADEAKILKAGSFEAYSGRNVRGMFILKTASLEQARSWIATDPAVKVGRLVPEFLKRHVEKGSLRLNCRAGASPAPAWREDPRVVLGNEC